MTVLLGSFVLSGCGKSGGGTLHIHVEAANGAAAVPSGGGPKKLQSFWTEINGLYTLDLRSAAFGVTSSVPVQAITGQSCTCSVLISGGETTGTMTVSNCSGAAQCTTFNTAGNYSRSGSDLLICSGAQCQTLR
ncbi:MAG: hypothetical protein AB7F86_19975 [Bdellovibrionales bacterium]